MAEALPKSPLNAQFALRSYRRNYNGLEDLIRKELQKRKK